MVTLSFLSEYSFTAVTAFHAKAQLIRLNNGSPLVFGPIDMFLYPEKPTFVVSCSQSRLVNCSVWLEAKSIDIWSKSFYANKNIQLCWPHIYFFTRGKRILSKYPLQAPFSSFIYFQWSPCLLARQRATIVINFDFYILYSGLVQANKLCNFSNRVMYSKKIKKISCVLLSFVSSSDVFKSRVQSTEIRAMWRFGILINKNIKDDKNILFYFFHYILGVYIYLQ